MANSSSFADQQFRVDFRKFDLYGPTDEHRMIRESVRAFAAGEVDSQASVHDRTETFNLKLFKQLGELGVLGLTVPEEFGGAGMDPTAVCIVHEELSAFDPGFCLAYLAHTLLMVNNLAVNGSDEQKRKYLPKLCSGEWVGAMAMSEPDAGTDVLGMTSSAVKKRDSWTLNGRKMWITNGTLDDGTTPADVVWVYAKTGASGDRQKLSTFIVENGMSGYSVGQKIMDKLGMRASNTAELVFENCEVPAANLVGAEGDSVRHMMGNLEVERVGLAAMGLGIARRCIGIMNSYARERSAFGKSIDQFGQIQQHIADSYAEYRAARAYVYETARKMSVSGSGNRLDSDGVKLVATRMAKNVADRAIQVLGGYGYVGEYHVERLWRDAKLLEIGGGTTEAHQKNITRDLADHVPFDL